MLSDARQDSFDAFGYADRFHDAVPVPDAECDRAIDRAYPEGPGRVHDPRLPDTPTTIPGTRVEVKPLGISRFAVPANRHRDCSLPLRAPSDGTEADHVALHLGEFFEYETGSELCGAVRGSGVLEGSDAVFGRVRDGAAG